MQLIAAAVTEHVKTIAQSFNKNINVTPEMRISDIGLDSIDKIELVMQIEEEFGIDVEDDASVAMLGKTITEVAHEIMQIKTTNSAADRSLTEIKFEDMVADLVKPGEAIVAEMNLGKAITMSIHLTDAIRTSRKLDAMKKCVIYGKENMMPEPFVAIDELALAKMTPEQAHKLHMAIGLLGEAGEILEGVILEIEQFPRNIENEIEESGDIEFYHEGYRQACGFSREAAIKANIEKLGKRYRGHKYTDAQAIARADKASLPETIVESIHREEAPRSTADLDMCDKLGLA